MSARSVIVGGGIVFVLVLAACPATAGERSNARGMGMARTANAAAVGMEAVGINPALLALPGDETVAVTLLPFGLHAGSDLVTMDLYNKYFTGTETDTGRVARRLTDEDKQYILSRFAHDGSARTVVDVDATVFGGMVRLGPVGTFALTVSERVGAIIDVPRDYAQFLFYGNVPGSTYDFSNSALTASWVREYALSYARPIPAPPFLNDLTAGISIKLVAGYGYYEVERFATRLATATNGVLAGTVDFRSRFAGADIATDGIGVRYRVIPEAAGSGAGLDLGLSASPLEGITVGLAVTDIGSVSWTEHIEEMVADTSLTIDDPLDVVQRDRIEHSLQGEKRDGTPFSTHLPTTIRVGVAVAMNRLPMFSDLPGELLLAVDVNAGLYEMPGTTMEPRGSVGIEFRPLHWLPIRTGVSFGGTDWYNIAAGVGINLSSFDLDLGTENFEALLNPESLSHGSVALGMRLKF